jgi:hypothetical protein
MIRHKRVAASPLGPHDFVAPEDSGRVQALGAFFFERTYGSTQNPSELALDADIEREQRCTVPGCGRDDEDPIHHVETGS